MNQLLQSQWHCWRDRACRASSAADGNRSESQRAAVNDPKGRPRLLQDFDSGAARGAEALIVQGAFGADALIETARLAVLVVHALDQ